MNRLALPRDTTRANDPLINVAWVLLVSASYHIPGEAEETSANCG
jgi:hypothetical protein